VLRRLGERSWEADWSSAGTFVLKQRDRAACAVAAFLMASPKQRKEGNRSAALFVSGLLLGGRLYANHDHLSDTTSRRADDCG